MKLLIACEESQRVCCAFRELGHEAYSCDIQEPSGGHPEWHILGDALRAIEGGEIVTMDGKTHYIGRWDLLIAHPPCTYLTVTGNRWFNVDRYGEKAIKRQRQRQDAIAFFIALARARCDRICIENPVGIMSTVYRKANQVIQPYQFGDAAEKKTCLWLKGLPKLQATTVVTPPERVKFASGKSIPAWYADAWHLPAAERSRVRSQTFPGIAKAMAEQWGGKVNDTENAI